MPPVVMSQTLDQFLASTERRALRMAMLACKNEADALDIVQDAMTSLVQNYSAKSAEQWPKLFQRILQNRILDWHRGGRIRSLFGFGKNNIDDGDDEVGMLAAETAAEPAERYVLAMATGDVLKAVGNLPVRQQQVLLLRALEQFNTEETAAALGISSGSVKTHYSRALRQVRQQLEVSDE